MFNRCVIFKTDRRSYHGHPEPLRCSEEGSRKSIACYYYRDERAASSPFPTHYVPLPGDSIGKKLVVVLTRYALYSYTALSRPRKLGRWLRKPTARTRERSG